MNWTSLILRYTGSTRIINQLPGLALNLRKHDHKHFQFLEQTVVGTIRYVYIKLTGSALIYCNWRIERNP